MPCYDALDAAEKEQAVVLLPKIEALLCSACRELEKNNYVFASNPALDEWWYQHKKRDADKNKADVVKALNMLRDTPLTENQIQQLKLIGIIK